MKENLLKAAQNQEKYQHTKAKYRNFVPGQAVFLYNRDCDRFKQTTKRRYNNGPYVIKKKHNDVNFTIFDPTNAKAKDIKVHCQRLIPFTVRKPELDLFQSLVQKPNSKESLQKNHTHAIFDDTSTIDLLWPTPTTIYSQPQRDLDEEILLSPAPSETDMQAADNDIDTNNTFQTPDTISTSSNDTIIYSPTKGDSDTIQTHTYDLRDLQPRYDPQRFLQWALDITK